MSVEPAAARPSTAFLDGLAADVAGLARSSTAERVAEVVRRRVIDGDLAPGTQLSEEQLCAVLQVSRNTLREAFRLLGHEGLLVHRLHRGVFVAELDDAALHDVYRMRRAIECDVVRRLGARAVTDTALLDGVRADVADGAASAARDDWAGVGTANMHFHSHLVALAGSPRLDAATARLLAELRLAFQGASAREMHEPWVARNAHLVELLAAGRSEDAAAALEQYLDDSLAHLIALRHQEQG